MHKGRKRYRVCSGFEDKALSERTWNDLLPCGSTDVLFLTWQWQKTWWNVFGRGKLLILVSEEDDAITSIAPLFEEYGMIYFIGSGGSDYLDFIGEMNAEDLGSMLMLAAESVNRFRGFQFYHIPETSATHSLLKGIAETSKWKLEDEGGWNCPRMYIQKDPARFEEAVRKKSLRRHENWFRRNGTLRVDHYNLPEDILPQLDAFFEQHISRWESTRFPSLFHDPRQKFFYTHLADTDTINWIRFTKVSWNGQPAAYHFGFHYKNSFLWYKPSFDIELAKHSPGEVLLRQLMFQASEEGALIFDLGLGDEDFKERFAHAGIRVLNYGLYAAASRNILVISPHPDDESIGCGGTIRKHIVEGDQVEVIFLTSGERGGSGKSGKAETMKIREAESRKAATILEVQILHFWREPDGQFEITENNLQKLIDTINRLKPSVIYVPHENENHPDHRAAAGLLRKALSLPAICLDEKPVVLMYEIWTPIQKVEHIVDITPYVETKRSAITAYESQCSLMKFHEAILGLNRYRGEMNSWPGGEYAEIFERLQV